MIIIFVGLKDIAAAQNIPFINMSVARLSSTPRFNITLNQIGISVAANED
jgi:hypothetical protein